jgi:hypothetical protein
MRLDGLQFLDPQPGLFFFPLKTVSFGFSVYRETVN